MTNLQNTKISFVEDFISIKFPNNMGQVQSQLTELYKDIIIPNYVKEFINDPNKFPDYEEKLKNLKPTEQFFIKIITDGCTHLKHLARYIHNLEKWVNSLHKSMEVNETIFLNRVDQICDLGDKLVDVVSTANSFVNHPAIPPFLVAVKKGIEAARTLSKPTYSLVKEVVSVAKDVLAAAATHFETFVANCVKKCTKTVESYLKKDEKVVQLDRKLQV